MKTKSISPANSVAQSRKLLPKTKRAPGQRLLPPGSAGVVTHWWEVQWPRIGGISLLPLASDAFEVTDFRSA